MAVPRSQIEIMSFYSIIFSYDYLLMPLIVVGIRRSAVSVYMCHGVSVRMIKSLKNGWNYNHQTCHRDSSSRVLAHQLKGQSHKVQNIEGDRVAGVNALYCMLSLCNFCIIIFLLLTGFSSPKFRDCSTSSHLFFSQSKRCKSIWKLRSNFIMHQLPGMKASVRLRVRSHEEQETRQEMR